MPIYLLYFTFVGRGSRRNGRILLLRGITQGLSAATFASIRLTNESSLI